MSTTADERVNTRREPRGSLPGKSGRGGRKPTVKKWPHFGLKLDPDMHLAIQRLADQQGTSLAAVTRQLIARALAETT